MHTPLKRALLKAAVLGAIALGAVAAPAAADWLGFLGVKGGTTDYDEKAGGTLLEQLEKNKAIPDAVYAPPESLLKPYVTASLGPDVALEVVNRSDLVNAPEAQKFSQALVDQLLAGWNGPKPAVKVLITGDPSYGAHAVYSGDILISIGTFNKDPKKGVQDKDELALMLGHELSHLLLLHLKRKQTIEDITDDLGVAASAYMTVATVRNSHMSGQTLQVASDTNMMSQALIGGLASSMLVGDLFLPQWGRADEYEADKVGLDLARRAGYFVGETEIRQFVEKHAEEQAQRSERMKRLQAVGTVMIMATNSKSAAAAGQGGSMLELGLKLLGTGALNKAFDGLAGMTADHPNKDEREAELVKYSLAAYGNKTTDANGKLLKKQAQELKKVEAQTSLRATLDSVVAAHTVDELLLAHTASTTPQATGTQTAATTAAPVAPVPIPSACGGRGHSASVNPQFPTDTAPLTWRSRGYWQSVSPGCQARARDDWERSARSNYASMDVLEHLAVEYSGTPKAGQLPVLYDRYKALIGTDEPFLDLAVAAAIARHDQAGAEVKAAECYGYKRHSLYPTCAKILGYDPLAKGGGAKTPEGQKAFQTAGVNGSIDDLFGASAGLFQ